MKLHKLDSFIKEKLDTQRISPSANLWNALETKMDTNKSKRRSRKLAYRSIALLLLIVGLGGFFLFQFPKPNLLNTQEIGYETPSTTEEPSQLQNEKPLPIPFKRKPIQQSLFFKESENLIVFNLQPKVSNTDFELISHPTLPVVFVSKVSQDSLLNIETDTLIQLAYAQLLLTLTEDSRRKKNALDLLQNIEDELISETFLKQKVLAILKNSYKKINVAQNEIK